MSLSAGIVGLPNVGKSTFFNAITNCGAQAANYPFCTIEPNIGIVPIRDSRLDTLAKLSASEKITPAIITFVDIAGLVRGASKGEGLGNKFLSHIREVSVIVHVVRCFEDSNIVHLSGKIDPIDDIEILNTELALADLESVSKMYDNARKAAKSSSDKEVLAKVAMLEKIKSGLEANTPVRKISLTEEEKLMFEQMSFLTSKPVIYVANVSEDMINKDSPLTNRVKQYAAASGDEFAIICAKIEDELAKLNSEEKQEFLKDMGIKEPGLDMIAHICFKLLGLQTYLTTGVKETRAWTIRVGDKAPHAAGVIHTDFERGFIKANVIAYDNLIKCGGYKEAKEKGLIRQEGKEYTMQDGDVVEFLFNV